MGQQQSTVYSVAVSQKKDGETEVRRSPVTVDGLYKTPVEGQNTLQDIWLHSVKQYGSQVALGYRAKDGKYKTRTFAEVHALAQNIGAGVKHLNLAPEINEYQNFNLQLVGIYAKNREEWALIDIGCASLYGMTIVPLYDTLGPDNLTYCLNHSGMEVVFCSTDSVDTLLKTEDVGRLRTIVALDDIKQEQKQTAESRGIALLSFQHVIETGRSNPSDFAQYDNSRIFTFSYTSGTTGKPKAAMLSHLNMASSCAVFHTNPSFSKLITDCKAANYPVRHLSYLPLPHVFERMVYTALLQFGGEVWFYSGDVTKIGQDLIDVKPSLFISVPRLFNKFYDKINDGFSKLPLAKRTLVKIAIAAKLRNIEYGPVYDHSIFDELIFKKIREGIFGGQIRMMITGSAPISKDVLNFFQICLSAPLIEGYGQTESTAASFTKFHTDSISGHIGGPCCNVEFKLEDIPEMNYLSTDKDAEGNICPRGEICMRGPGVFAGYYKDEEKTAEAIDADGWLHSGDVGSFDRKQFRLKIIDRKKNIFKLSQGEYVAPEKIEIIYGKVEGISEVFIYGDSLQSALVTIVVPEQPYIEGLGQKLEISGSFEELCANKEIRTAVLKTLNAAGKENKLFGFEQARNIKLETVSLQTKGCFTSTMKLQRHQAKIAFESEIKQLYAEMEQ